jgi:plastocyanin
LKLYIGEGALRGASRAATTIVKDAVVPVDSANIYLANIYAPIEVQYLPDESSIANPTGEPTVMVGKLRSPSSTSAMSTTTPFASTGDATADKAIFGTNYLDGHSAGQFTLGGELVFSNNAAKFAETREESKTTLGSVQKIGTAELLLGDAVRKRAIIAYTDLSTEETFVSWEYLSDRSVTDFRLEEIAEQTIVFDESGPDNAELVIRSGTTVTWRNDAAVPMTIYSGNVSTSQFNEDPDLTLYGGVFTSQELASGEEYSFTFDNPGDFHWFAYPGIANAEVNGIVRVSSGRISPSDTYLLVENDLQAETVSGRVIKIDAWGNVQWTYGEGILHQPRDVRPMPDGTLLIST